MGGAFGNMMARHARQISGHDWVSSTPVSSPAPQRSAKHRKLRGKLQALTNELARIQRNHDMAKAEAFTEFRHAVTDDAALRKFVGNKTIRQVLHMVGVDL